MAYSYVYQQVHSVTIPREQFLINIVYNTDLNKVQIRVAIFLLTQLHGYKRDGKATKDPYNFTAVDKKQIATTLNLSVKEVKEAFKKFEYIGIIEKGEMESADIGYRFTF